MRAAKTPNPIIAHSPPPQKEKKTIQQIFADVLLRVYSIPGEIGQRADQNRPPLSLTFGHADGTTSDQSVSMRRNGPISPVTEYRYISPYRFEFVYPLALGFENRCLFRTIFKGKTR